MNERNKGKGNKKDTYWYRYHYEDCPVCGASNLTKERVYIVDEPKPTIEDINRKYTHGTLYCTCYYYI